MHKIFLTISANILAVAAHNQKACSTFQVGTDYLFRDIEKMTDQYMYVQNQLNMTAVKDFHVSMENPGHSMVVGDDHLKYTKDITIILEHGMMEFAASVDFKFKVKGGSKLEFKPEESFRFKTTKDSDKCTQKCREAVSQIRKDLTKIAFDFGGEFYDQPIAARFTKGLMQMVNRQQDSRIELTKTSFDIYFNCKKDMKLGAIRTDIFEVSASDNFIELFYPYNVELDTHWLIKSAQAHIDENIGDRLRSLGLGDIEGTFKLVGDDFKILEQVNSKKLQTPSWFTKTNKNGLDRITIKNNILVQFEDTKTQKFQDISIFPVEVTIELNAALTPGDDSPIGQLQDLQAELVNIDFKMKPCQFVTNPNPRPIEKNSDDDEEEEEDEDEDEDNTKPKISPLSKLLCSLGDKANTQFVENHGKIMEELKSRTDQYSKKYEIDMIGHPYYPLCAGLFLRQPQGRIEKDRLVISTQMEKNAKNLNIDVFCLTKDKDFLKEDARVLHVHEHKRHEHHIIINDIKGDETFSRIKMFVQEYHEIPTKLILFPILHHLVNSIEQVEFCKKNQPHYPSDRCGLAYTFMMRRRDFEGINNFIRWGGLYKQEMAMEGIKVTHPVSIHDEL